MTLWYEANAGDIAPEACWELYHENSKNGRRVRPAAQSPSVAKPAPEGAAPRMHPLGAPALLDISLDAALAAKPELLRAGRIPLAALSALLAGDDGVGGWLELRFHASGVDDFGVGLYALDASANSALLLTRGDLGSRIAGALVEPETIDQSAVQVFLVGLFDHAYTMRGERGYRAALMAAGARTRQLAMTAAALRLGAARLDFYDRELDAILGLDGLTRGTLAVIAIGAGTTEG